jgi:hypothetical protein
MLQAELLADDKLVVNFDEMEDFDQQIAVVVAVVVEEEVMVVSWL